MRVGKVILTALWLSTTVTTVAATSAGQTPPEPAAANAGDNAEAARHYEEGVAAAKLTQWAKAHESFLKAWKITQHYQIAANLGRAELKLGKYRDAAEHLAYFLREASGVTTEERQAAQTMLDEARAKVGAVTIIVDRAGAEVLVDGVAIGKSPLGREVFVEPGKRTVEAKLGGFGDDRRALDVAAGTSPRVLITLSQSSGGKVGPGAQPPIAAPKTGPEETRPGTSEPGGTRGSGGRTTVLVVGSVTAVAFAAAGAGFLIGWGAENSDVEKDQETLGRIEYACSAPLQGSSRAETCTSLQDAVDRRGTFGALGVVGLGLGVAAGAATLIYAVTDSPSTQPTARSSRRVRVLPIAALHGGGMSLVGQW